MTKSDKSTRCKTCVYIHDPNTIHNRWGLCARPQCASKAPHAFLLCEDAIKANSGRLAMNQIGIGFSQISNIGSSYEPADVDSLNLTLHINARKSRTTALETAVLTAMNEESSDLPLHMWQVALMMDSGAQRSVITKQAVQSMKFPIVGTEKVALQGFNERSPHSLTYNVAQIQLGKPFPGSKNITIDALVVGDINRVMMVGAAAFAKKLSKKNYSLADYRFLTSKSDEVKIDMLVGNEHRYRIISPRALPVQLYGM